MSAVFFMHTTKEGFLYPTRLGYVPRAIPDPKRHILGDASLPFSILQESGQWDEFLPMFESQVENGYDPRSCVSEAYTTCQEILERRLFGTAPEYSERFLAQISGTAKKGGNSLHDVAETGRLVGLIPENEWPSSGIREEQFYAQPLTSLYSIAAADHQKYARFHKDVPATKEAIKQALKSSPLSFAIFAWARRPDGTYYEPAGAQDTHCPVIYGYTDTHVKVFDSVDPYLKEVEWEAINGEIKQYAVMERPPEEMLSRWEKMLRFMLQLLGLQERIQNMPPEAPKQPVEPPKPVDTTQEPATPKRDLLGDFCEAIADYEGGPNDLNHRNNNPGNLRRWHTQTGTRGGFAVFATWDDGMDALKELVTMAASGESSIYRPSMRLYNAYGVSAAAWAVMSKAKRDEYEKEGKMPGFFQCYAPAEDHNNPARYADYIASRIGASITIFRIRDLIA